MHALAFRVMRLCKPNLSCTGPLRLDLKQDMALDGTLQQGAIAGSDDPLTGHHSFAERTQLDAPLGALALDGLMELPQTFGNIYLGETFCSYISVGNYSDRAVTSVIIKAELHSERARAVLYDTSAAPLPAMGPGARHDFVIRHDVKEVGPHSLVCSTSYAAPPGEPAFLPQYFKFSAHNPLSVRTKTRAVAGAVLLEACVENATRGPLLLEYVRFDPLPPLAAHPIAPQPAPDLPPGSLCAYIESLHMVAAGGSANFVYHVEGAGAPGASPALGKLEIRWRSTLGDTGRLQTQQILLGPRPRKEAELTVASGPPAIVLEQPFVLRLRVCSHVERRLGRMVVRPPTLSDGPGPDDTAAPVARRGAVAPPGVPGAVQVVGLTRMVLEELPPAGNATAEVMLIALRPGVQQLPALRLSDESGERVYDTLSGNILVEE